MQSNRLQIQASAQVHGSDDVLQCRHDPAGRGGRSRDLFRGRRRRRDTVRSDLSAGLRLHVGLSSRGGELGGVGVAEAAMAHELCNVSQHVNSVDITEATYALRLLGGGRVSGKRIHD